MPISELANPSATRAVLEQHGFYTKHRLGQNFLVSDAVIAHIVELAELAPEDIVLEVGPGIGTLTVALLPRVAKVIAVEADHALEPVLAKTCAVNSERLELIWGDAVRAIPDALPEAPEFAPSKFVANLPYQVAATLILKVLSEVASVQRIVVMVQAEVADRICAKPGSRTYGAYTAKLALWGQVTGRFEVGAANFMPPPHVNSAVIRIDRAPLVGPGGLPLSAEACMQVAAVIDAAFAQRRKTIRNAMAASGFDKEALDSAFAKVGIAATCRAETLAPEMFVRLADALSSIKTQSQES